MLQNPLFIAFQMALCLLLLIGGTKQLQGQNDHKTIENEGVIFVQDTLPSFLRVSWKTAKTTQKGTWDSAFRLFVDKKGYVWTGSMGGLIRFDGYGFKPFSKNALSPNRFGQPDFCPCRRRRRRALGRDEQRPRPF